MNDQAAVGRDVLRVPRWGELFENSKSKDFGRKTACQMPLKMGLGYGILARRRDFAEIFGAWCALIQVLSRHEAPRGGWLTDDGKPEGKPYDASQLSAMTRLAPRSFEKMLGACEGSTVGWLVRVGIPQGECADTAGGSRSLLNSNSNSHSNSNAAGAGLPAADDRGEGDEAWQAVRGCAALEGLTWEQWRTARRELEGHPQAERLKADECGVFISSKAVLGLKPGQAAIEKPGGFVRRWMELYLEPNQGQKNKGGAVDEMDERRERFAGMSVPPG